MPTARKLPSGSWRCQAYDYTDHTGKRHYRSFTASTRREAELLAAQFQNAEKHTVCDMTVGEALKAYIRLREPVLSPSTVSGYTSIAETRMRNIQGIQVYKLTQKDVQMMINDEVRQGKSPKTIRNIHNFLSAVLRVYRPEFILKTKLPEKIKPDLYIPSDEDVKQLMARLRGTEMELPVLLASFGPMRRGEIAALDVRNIDGNVVHVCENMVVDRSGNWHIKAPKSYAGDRYIDFPDFVVKLWEGKTGRVTDLNPNQISHRFETALKQCGLPHFRFHDLRHYSASIQHALGIPDSYIMQRGGWSSDATLKSVYRHAMDQEKKKMSDLANSHFESMHLDVAGE